MAKVKYDVSNVEKRTFEVPKPGVYEATIFEATHGNSSSGNPMFTITFEITKGEYKGSRIWYYILTDGSQNWRLREFTDALGLKPKGDLEPGDLKGMAVQLRTDIDPPKEGYDEKARVKNVLPAKGGAGATGGDEEEEDAPYEEWELAELKEEVQARGLKVPGKQTTKKLIAALEASDAEGEEDEEDEEDEEEEEEGEEEGLTRADLDDMSRTELKKLIADEELEIKITKKTTEEQLRDKIAEALELDEDDEEDDDEEEEEEEGEDEKDTNFEEWGIADLKAELKERGLKTDGRKSTLVARLKKDEESSDEPF